MVSSIRMWYRCLSINLFSSSIRSCFWRQHNKQIRIVWEQVRVSNSKCSHNSESIKRRTKKKDLIYNKTGKQWNERMGKWKKWNADLLVSFLFPCLNREGLNFTLKLVHLHVQSVYCVLRERNHVITALFASCSKFFYPPTVIHEPSCTVSHCSVSSFSFCAGSTFWAKPSPSLE